jgi:lactate permease
MQWTQIYDPLGSAWLSTFVAALPVVLLLGSLGLLGWSAPRAAALGLVSALGVAILIYRMPGRMAIAAAVNGASFGLFPIGWIVLAAIFLYTLTVETGQFEIVKNSVAGLSADRRLQALLIAFSFGAFVEGAAGFGTPVAISAALMIGTGFSPIHAAGLALIANTSPVAFGALGTPIVTLTDVTLPHEVTTPAGEILTGEAARAAWELQLSQMAGRQLPFFSLIVPAWLVWTMAGWRGVKGVMPAILVSGGSFALVQFLVSNYLGPRLVDVAGGLVSLTCLALFLKLWRPSEIWDFDSQQPNAPPPVASSAAAARETRHSTREVISAWVPWVLLSVCVFLWGLPQVRTFLDGGLSDSAIAARKAKSSDSAPIQLQWWERPNLLGGITLITVKVPYLHNQIFRDEPVVVHKEKPEAAEFKLNWLSATGTGIMVAAVLSAFWLRVRPGPFALTFLRTCYRMRWPLFTIATMLAIAYTTRYSGTDATLGLAFTHTGLLYPFFAAMLGWLGVALTGSDTSSNALFGSLQKITAEGLVKRGVLNLSTQQATLLMAAANSTGGVMGKMIDAQSIVVSAAATQQPGQEGQILRFVFWHSLSLAALMGGLVFLQAYVLKWMIPG